jgi:hypothetical protein
MRWLMIGLLVSLGALLLAAAGVARHIWLHRTKNNRNPNLGTTKTGSKAPGAKQYPSQNPSKDVPDEPDI